MELLFVIKKFIPPELPIDLGEWAISQVMYETIIMYFFYGLIILFVAVIIVNVLKSMLCNINKKGNKINTLVKPKPTPKPKPTH